MRFVLVGGFLGAGKTTALMRLARSYAEMGWRVGIITNDQGDGLVDTQTFRAAGFSTQEVPRGCFCCRFDELVVAAGRLQDGHEPEVILAEPVGSCTDLVATVINPLRRLYAARFSVAPYAALLDPARAISSLSGRRGFSAKVTYLYKMQQNEADIVAINKVDTLDAQRRAELRALVARNFPRAQVIEISARTGEGFDRLVDLLDGDGPGGNVIDVDYDTYAEGEARLGWLNATLQVTSTRPMDGGRFMLDLLRALQSNLREADAEPAHVKITLRSGDDVAVANLLDRERPPELSNGLGFQLTKGILLINARVESSPDALQSYVERAVAIAANAYGVTATVRTLDAFAPARPTPTHRLSGDSEALG